MSEEVVLTTGESSESVSSAEQAADQAREAAVAANAAAVNQGQLIQAVTDAAREDASREASRATSEAERAASEAEQAKALNEETKSVFSMLIGPIISRIEELERGRQEPQQVVVGEVNGATPIDPSQQEGEQQQESQESGDSESSEHDVPSKSNSRRRHGRRKR